uniref:Phospholipase A-2-activating protein n=1 Tax=Vannella robusta TaxID=1487602 RepID=A0A7S4I5I2_9EUKA|mmetsp:Transcript_20837/g.26362  ORF Transcript_20837/g.26362 Transcript_20837/m.26362 type:complete len:701 (+) Transcript_20837:38-2140(+)
MELSEYRLRQCLAGHTADVKYAMFDSQGNIVTVSRDTTAKIWSQNDSVFEVVTTLNGHSNFVNAVLELGKSEKFPDGALVTASTDSTVLLWDRRNLSEPFYTLIGHTNTVCSLALNQSSLTLISGSYDGTCILWDLNSGTQKLVLDAHKPSVLCVTVLQDGNFATGGSDKLIKLWNSTTGELIRTFQGHTDAVRKLVQVDLGLCSCSNDGTVRVWDLGGECLQQYVGHQSFVYGITCIDGVQEFATGAEDQLVNVWKGGSAIQSIAHPGSVWSVEHRVSENGISELLTGCSDGIARLWTKDAAFALSEEEMSAYYQDIEKMAKEQKQPSQSTAQEINGKKYDYVWDVDLGPEHPRLYLGHNQGDDPMDSARTFVYDNNLAIEHVQTIVDFIKTNSSPFEIVSQAPDVNPEPVKPTGPPALFPVLHPIGFTSLNSLKHIKRKILSLNEEFELKDSEYSLSGEHLHSLTDLVNTLQETAKYHVSRVYEDHVKLLTKLLQWPADFTFVCNDLFRSTMVHPTGGAQIAKTCPNAVQLLMNSGCNADASEKSFLTASQALANLFCIENNPFSYALLEQREKIIDTLNLALQSEEKVSLKTSVTAISTVLLNFAVLLSKTPGDTDAAKIQCASVLLEFIRTSQIQKTDEAIFRSIVAIGTLASSSQLALGLFAAESPVIESVQSKDERIQKAIQMLQKLFSQLQNE